MPTGRKAYCPISVHGHLVQIPTPEITDLRMWKVLELAKEAGSEGG
jgi:hypothetical protein